MFNPVRAFRRALRIPSADDILFANRGFPGASSPIAGQLEGAGLALLKGFETSIAQGNPNFLAQTLERVDPFYRSLAFEGAVTGLILRDIIDVGRRGRAYRFVQGPGAPHALMAWFGYGQLLRWLPRPIWQSAMPHLDGKLAIRKFSWLAIDAYGFDCAYMETNRWVTKQRVPKPYHWEGSPGYFQHAFDQGIGRALYFIHGGQVPDIAEAISRFPALRQPDLWSGIGGASTYLGGLSAADLQTLGVLAGVNKSELAVGAVFAIKARHHAGYIPACTETAAHVYCDMSVDAAASLADAATREADKSQGSNDPEYVRWRRYIRRHFDSGHA
ncbi:DUF1702 family protein [Mycobacterium sp. 852002-40037_SCH5390672]|uniref:DUF1702 family protein n=1 Tax=Mycobacterium sp. 852002-40037_SCH5390672 TaxID=1834089 RepID=UPI0009ED40E8|nr:DUF1702 family protein [Mycobacterium sp. 852002-40037_SCH5390672]